MNEYNQFIEYRPQMRKDKCGGGLDSCSGEGMLDTEAIKNAPGLTPLRFVNEILYNEIEDGNIKSDFTDGKTLKNSSGLNTLHPFDEIHDMDMDFEQRKFPFTEMPWRTSSGLAPLRPGSKINKIRVIE
ncbi:MAG: hypothetical protein WA144_07475 [Candidatus Methanoperedens sp.]